MLPQFSIGDVEVGLGVIDLDQIRSKRAGNSSRGDQSATSEEIPRIFVDFEVCK